MNIRHLSTVLCGATTLLVTHIVAQERAADPLPSGALARFGTSRPILRSSPAVALLAPKYSNFLAPTMTGGIRRYDLATGRPLDKKGIVGPGAVIVSADGKRAVVALQGALNVVEVATGRTVLPIQPPAGVIIVGIPSVALSEDGKFLAFAGRGQDKRGEVVVMDVDQNEVVAQCTTHHAAPVQVTLSRDGKTLVSYGPPLPLPTLSTIPKVTEKLPDAGDARTAQVWEVASGRELFKARVSGMAGNVVSAALSPDADLLAISAGDGPVDLFDVTTGKHLRTLLGRKSQGARVAISPDAKIVASVGLDFRIQRWQADGKPMDITDPPPHLRVAPITGLEFADNERVIASMTLAQFAYAWDAPTGRLLSPEMDHAADLRSIAFPVGGKELCTSGNEGRAFRWDLATGQLGEEIVFRPAQIPGQPMIRPAVYLSVDGTYATWPFGAFAEIFDGRSGDNLFVLPPPSSPPAAVNMSLSQDSRRLVMFARPKIKARKGMCVVWDLPTRKRVADFEIPPLPIGSTPVGVFSPDGNRLVVAAFADRPDGRILTYTAFDLKTGKRLSVVEDSTVTGGNAAVAVANETTLVGATAAGRLWTVDYVNGQIGEDIETLVATGEPPIHGPIAISPDSKRFAIGVIGAPFTMYGIRVYDLATRKMTHTFFGHAGPVTTIRFTPDSNAVASGAQDTSVLLWDLTKARQEK